MKTNTTCTPQLRVLIADDNPVSQMFAARLLERQGHSAHVVANGSLAVDAILDQDFDLVLMDLSMPVMDGFEAVRQLREREQSIGFCVPVIALTSSNSIEDREKCLTAGMDDFVSKPMQAGDLESALARILKDQSCNSTEAESSHSDSTESETPVVCDLITALRRANGDECFLKQLAEKFLEIIPGQLNELRISVQKEKWQLAADYAHSVKGTVRHFAATAAYEAALRMELICSTGNGSVIAQTYLELQYEVNRLRAELSHQLRQEL